MFFLIRLGFAGLSGIKWVKMFFPSGWDVMNVMSGIKWRWVVLLIRMRFVGLCSWVEWDNVAFVVFFFSISWDLMD